MMEHSTGPRACPQTSSNAVESPTRVLLAVVVVQWNALDATPASSSDSSSSAPLPRPSEAIQGHPRPSYSASRRLHRSMTTLKHTRMRPLQVHVLRRLREPVNSAAVCSRAEAMPPHPISCDNLASVRAERRAAEQGLPRCPAEARGIDTPMWAECHVGRAHALCHVSRGAMPVALLLAVELRLAAAPAAHVQRAR